MCYILLIVQERYYLLNILHKLLNKDEFIMYLFIKFSC